MLRKLEKALRPWLAVSGNRHALLAVSGGADSIALLHTACRLRERFDLRLTAAHFHHGLRGRDADEDAAFVETRCREWEVPLVSGHGRVTRQGGSLEAAARQARHRFFRTALKETGASAVWLAHTRDDQAETLLGRLARGAGPGGLGGMQVETTLPGLQLFRPMLDVSREEVIRTLRTHRVSWREDASNRDPAFTRNRIRHELLPLLEQRFQPAIRTVLARTAEMLRRDDECLRQQASEALAQAGADTPGSLRVEALVAESPAIRTRMWLGWLRSQGVGEEGMTLALLDRLDQLLPGGGTREVPLDRDRVVRRCYGTLMLQPVDAGESHPVRVRLKRPGWTEVPELGLRVHLDRDRGFQAHPAGTPGGYPAEAWISADAVGRAGLFLRTRRAGDRLTQRGGGSRKIQDILTDAKVPRGERGRVPLLECRRQIVWVPGCRVARGWDVPGRKAASLRIAVAPMDGFPPFADSSSLW